MIRHPAQLDWASVCVCVCVFRIRLLHFLFILSCRSPKIHLATSSQLYANESMSDHVGFARVFIELINENDNRPIFSKPLYNISLPENTAPGTSLLRIRVSAVTHPCSVFSDLFRLQHSQSVTFGLFYCGCIPDSFASLHCPYMSFNYRDSSLPQNKKKMDSCRSCGLVLNNFIGNCKSTLLRKPRMCFTILSP